MNREETVFVVVAVVSALVVLWKAGAWMCRRRDRISSEIETKIKGLTLVRRMLFLNLYSFTIDKHDAWAWKLGKRILSTRGWQPEKTPFIVVRVVGDQVWFAATTRRVCNEFIKKTPNKGWGNFRGKIRVYTRAVSFPASVELTYHEEGERPEREKAKLCVYELFAQPEAPWAKTDWIGKTTRDGTRTGVKVQVYKVLGLAKFVEKKGGAPFDKRRLHVTATPAHMKSFKSWFPEMQPQPKLVGALVDD